MPADFIIPLYDMVAVTIIIIIGICCAKKGFARGVLDFLAYIFSLAGAYIASKAGALFIYEVMIKKNILSMLEKAISSVEGAVGLADVLDQLPNFINKLMKLIGKQVPEGDLLGETVVTVAQAVEQELIGPAVTLFIQIISMLLLFGVLFFLTKRLSRIIAKLFDLPLIGTMNHIAGFVLGIFEAWIILYIVIMVLKLVIALTGGFPPYLTTEVLDSTLFSRWMATVGNGFTKLFF